MGRNEQIKPQATRQNQEEEVAWLLFRASRDTKAGVLHLCICGVVRRAALAPAPSHVSRTLGDSVECGARLHSWVC